MSSNKKRRLEGLETPKPMSAISALAARRREAATASTPTTDASPEVDDQPVKSGSKGVPNASPSKGTPRPHLQKRGSEPSPARLKGVDSKR
ncbi:Polynucleotide 5'-hydroxyl-kinase grc3 [Neonectria magnoliae]|uniref:Polynucleotide 5'-hydroxyl-kinase grc3 n=1 Tax=Neonectria magnoliae TaxID=2732573 RepID=A0ABR1HMR2_9HYPO